jgi:hypothetical protein
LLLQQAQIEKEVIGKLQEAGGCKKSRTSREDA